MKKYCIAIILGLFPFFPASADTVDATCVIYPAGSDHAKKMIPCTFSQRQGYVRIGRSDGVEHDLSPEKKENGNFVDQNGNSVYRQKGLGDQGLIFRFPEESVYVYWNTGMLKPIDNDENPTAPFTTAEYNATALLRCRTAGETKFDICAAGIMRMENGQASITVLNKKGERFTINFMKDYINATNRELKATLKGDTWILEFSNGEVWEVPVAAITGD